MDMNSDECDVIFLELRENGKEAIPKELERFLERRPEKQDLIGKHILKEYSVAPCLTQITEKLVWENKTKKLQKQITKRPNIDALIEKRIIPEGDKKETYKEVAQKLEEKVSKRPEVGELIEKGIMNKCSTTSPSIMRTIQKLDRDMQKDLLSVQLSKRPSVAEVSQRVGYNVISRDVFSLNSTSSPQNKDVAF